MSVGVPARVFLLTAAVAAALLLALAAIGRPERWPPPESPPQQGEAAAADGASACHRAEALARLVREPQNAWSNLAFVAGGAFLIAGAGRMPRALGVALVGVGVGSFLYHASASRALRQLDVGAMYALFLLAGIFSLATLRDGLRPAIERRAPALLAVALGAAVALALARNIRLAGVKPFSLTAATAVTAALMLAALARSAWRRRRWAGAATVVALFGGAVICQWGDRPGGWLFAPAAPLQAHAAWHVLSAAAFVLAVRILDAAAAPVSDLRASVPRTDALP